MAIPLKRQLDAENRVPIISAAPATAAGHLVEYNQWLAGQANTSWKDSVRAASTVAITLSAPGAMIDVVTMDAGDRFLAKDQASQPENGIYIWNGAATPATRASDANTFASLEAAVVLVEEGTSNAATRWRQTQVNGVIGTNNVIFANDATAAPAASETTAGIVELLTQAEMDAGTDGTRAATALTIANWANRAKRFSVTFGDGAATSYVITHNLNTLDVLTTIREVGGSVRDVIPEVQHTSVNSVTVLFDAAPALNSLRAIVVA